MTEPDRPEPDRPEDLMPDEPPVVQPVEETEAYAEAVDDDSVLPELNVDPPPGPGPQRPRER
ncbi:hypothetical protein [Rhizomonospora bruguierae]|uniref:hypothetical protein n=1 Tax=Rhizomonospora bruguierae TaxID=1581705 RepID=UPI001BCD54EA|nr:hypothetical protein [Micromonospora sp. NBRC 107566]